MNIQDVVHARNPAFKISPLLVDRSGEQEIPDGMPAWGTWLSWESKAEQICCGRFRVREGDEAVPKVAHRRDPKLLS